LVGLTILGIGVLGVASVFGRNPSPTAGYAVLRRAGGALGAAVAWPLSRGVSVYGAVVVCLGLAALGCLVFTATPLAAVGRAMARLVRTERRVPDDDEASDPDRRQRRPHLRVVGDRDVGPPVGAAMTEPEADAVTVAEPKQIR